MSAGYRTLHLDDIRTIRFPEDAHDPRLEARAPRARRAGLRDERVRRHRTPGTSSSSRTTSCRGDGEPAGHQEIYLVLDGAARFTVDGESFDVPKGGIVFLEDPALHRQAVALEDGTVVFAVGAAVGRAFVPSRVGGRVLRARGRGSEAVKRRRRRVGRRLRRGPSCRRPFLVRDQPVARELLARLGEREVGGREDHVGRVQVVGGQALAVGAHHLQQPVERGVEARPRRRPRRRRRRRCRAR